MGADHGSHGLVVAGVGVLMCDRSVDRAAITIYNYLGRRALSNAERVARREATGWQAKRQRQFHWRFVIRY